MSRSPHISRVGLSQSCEDGYGFTKIKMQSSLGTHSFLNFDAHIKTRLLKICLTLR